uniref:Uncharacterized protein n=1 Tax=Heterorhabditis bacteriophora TaxID=37862 RepID=A0A1I7X156_HETBA
MSELLDVYLFASDLQPAVPCAGHLYPACTSLFCIPDDYSRCLIHALFIHAGIQMPSLFTTLSDNLRKESKQTGFCENADVRRQERGYKRFKMRDCGICSTSYSQYFKLMVLLVTAAFHVGYVNDFLVTFRAFESLANQVEENAAPIENNLSDVATVRFVMTALVDYKKNLWVSVGAMCASLSTSSFFVLLIDYYGSKYHRATIGLVRVVDFCAFVALPFLITARLMIAQNLETYMDPALRAAGRLADPQQFINELKCSITMRENLPLCAVVMERAIFPVKVLEYLIILCILTGAYILLAYLIEYCIRHWFPPNRNSRTPVQKPLQPLVIPSKE